MHTPDRRLSALDLAESLQLAQAISALHVLGVTASLGEPITADDLARRHRLDPAMLRGTLDYLAARSTLLRKTGARYVATRHWSSQARFLVDLYALAYGRNAAQLPQLLRDPTRAPAAVDRDWHARAFDEAGSDRLGALPGLVRQLGFNRVLDLGCGPARMLIALASSDPGFSAWGMELHPAMCKAARAAVRTAGLGRRVRIVQGDALRVDRDLPARVADAVGAVTASQLANELFGAGTQAAVAWLRRLRAALPGRPLLLADYCGRLGSPVRPAQRETLLHDYAQLISGQGIPPATLKGWQAIYRAAGCRLVHVIEDRRSTLFVHLLKL